MKNNFFCIFVMFFFVACSHQKEVVILSTNDTHSQVEPIVLLEDEGGYVSRLAIIDSIRQKEKDLLLLDVSRYAIFQFLWR